MCNKIVSNVPFKLKHCHDKYKTQEMYNKTVNDFLTALKLVLHWFVTSKLIKSYLLLYIEMIIYSILVKVLVIPYLLIMKWVFLV